MSLDTLPSVPVHPTEDLLEEYSFGRVWEPALAPLEEHLLDCTLCQDRLLAVDEYTALMKAGIAALEREREATRPSSALRNFLVRQWLLRYRSDVACWLASLLVLAGLQPSGEAVGVVPLPMTVKLTALRGGDGDGVARAPFGRPLELDVRSNGLAGRVGLPSGSGQFHAATGCGAERRRSEPQSLSARVTARLAPGAYWVRLYADRPIAARIRVARGVAGGAGRSGAKMKTWNPLRPLLPFCGTIGPWLRSKPSTRRRCRT